MPSQGRGVTFPQGGAEISATRVCHGCHQKHPWSGQQNRYGCRAQAQTTSRRPQPTRSAWGRKLSPGHRNASFGATRFDVGARAAFGPGNRQNAPDSADPVEARSGADFSSVAPPLQQPRLNGRSPPRPPQAPHKPHHAYPTEPSPRLTRSRSHSTAFLHELSAHPAGSEHHHRPGRYILAHRGIDR